MVYSHIVTVIFFHFLVSIFCNLFPLVIVRQIIVDFGEHIRDAVIEDDILVRDENLRDFRLIIRQYEAATCHEIEDTEWQSGFDWAVRHIQIDLAAFDDLRHHIVGICTATTPDMF
jgi:hypothetical protein